MLQIPPRECYFFLKHPKEASVLLIQEFDGWSLPHCSLPTHIEHERAQLTRQALLESFGMNAVVLQIDYRWQKPQSGKRDTFFTLENLTPQQPFPTNASWVSRDACSTLKMAIPEHYHVLETWWRERESIGTSQGVPWQYPGWFTTVAAWMTLQLDRLQMPLIAPIEQRYTKLGACMLRAHTTAGLVYLKAVPTSFAHEPRLVFWLDQHYPGTVPRVLAVENERFWLLTQDVGGHLLQADEQIENWEQALRDFASLQIKCVSALDDLFAVGCVDLRLKRMEGLLEPLLEDKKSLLLDTPGGLTTSEVEQLSALLPQMKAACHQLGSYRVPQTLEHGDFNPSNILVQDEHMVYLDWTDSSITHPFFSALRLLHYCLTSAIKTNTPQAVARLRLAYLEPWTEYEPIERLLQAFNQALLPMMMHRALFYAQLPFAQQGIIWERSIVVPNQLRALLRQRDAFCF